jgi:hypothetical protein
MAEHKHGEMNIEVHEKTFEGFIRASAYVAVGSIVVLILIAFINV